MEFSTLNPTRGAPVQDRLERRRNQRFPLALLGRFMLTNKQEYVCKLVNVSVCGAEIHSDQSVETGERIIAYFDYIGGIEGIVVRSFQGGFAIELCVTEYKREKLASQISQLINRGATARNEQARRHERFALANNKTTLKLDEHIVVEASVLDLSMSGASVSTDARPPLGTNVQLGKLRGRVVRHHNEGIGIEFLDLQNAEAIRRYFG